MTIVAAPTSSADPVDSRAMLLDGTVATLRVTGPADCSPLRRFFHELSPESRRLRFFKLADPDGALIDAFCDSSNPKRQATVVALRLLDGSFVPLPWVFAHCADGRPGRLLIAERSARHGDPAARDRSPRRPLVLCERRQQGRRVEQRPARVLGSRPRDR